MPMLATIYVAPRGKRLLNSIPFNRHDSNSLWQKYASLNSIKVFLPQYIAYEA
jgi:hypothetical protein